MKQLGVTSQFLAFALVVGAVSIGSSADAASGQARVTDVQGAADFTDGSGTWMALTRNRSLPAGSLIRTGGDGDVSLNLGNNGRLVNLKPGTTLSLDRLTYESTGIDVVVDTQLDLKAGRILGIVDRLSPVSKYEVKTPQGVVGIRAARELTRYDISASGLVRVLEGEVVVVYVDPNTGEVVTVVVEQGNQFVPGTPPSPIPPDELENLEDEFEATVITPTEVVTPVTRPFEFFISPTTGKSDSQSNQGSTGTTGGD